MLHSARATERPVKYGVLWQQSHSWKYKMKCRYYTWLITWRISFIYGSLVSRFLNWLDTYLSDCLEWIYHVWNVLEMSLEFCYGRLKNDWKSIPEIRLKQSKDLERKDLFYDLRHCLKLKEKEHLTLMEDGESLGINIKDSMQTFSNRFLI